MIFLEWVVSVLFVISVTAFVGFYLEIRGDDNDPFD